MSDDGLPDLSTRASVDEDKIEKFCDQVTNQLIEMGCDAVQLLASWVRRPDGFTCTAMRGSGNWHARVGLVKEFMDGCAAEENADRIASKVFRDDEDF